MKINKINRWYYPCTSPFIHKIWENEPKDNIFLFLYKVLNDTKQGFRLSNIDFSIKLNVNLVETINEVPNTLKKSSLLNTLMSFIGTKSFLFCKFSFSLFLLQVYFKI